MVEARREVNIQGEGQFFLIVGRVLGRRYNLLPFNLNFKSKLLSDILGLALGLSII